MRDVIYDGKARGGRCANINVAGEKGGFWLVLRRTRKTLEEYPQPRQRF